MKLNKSIGIYYKSHPKLLDIIQYFRTIYSDMVIFTNNNDGISSEFVVLPKFYGKFFHGEILYIDYNDFINNINNDLQTAILFIDSDQIDNIEFNIIKNHKILFIQNDNIIIKDYKNELQQLVR